MVHTVNLMLPASCHNLKAPTGFCAKTMCHLADRIPLLYPGFPVPSGGPLGSLPSCACVRTCVLTGSPLGSASWNSVDAHSRNATTSASAWHPTGSSPFSHQTSQTCFPLVTQATEPWFRLPVSLTPATPSLGLPASRLLHPIPCMVTEYTTLIIAQHLRKKHSTLPHGRRVQTHLNPLACLPPLLTHPPCSAPFLNLSQYLKRFRH